MPSDGVNGSLCFNVPENARLNKRLADVISVGRVCCSIRQHCYGIRVACGNTEEPEIKQRRNCKSQSKKIRRSSPTASCRKAGSYL